MRSNSSFAAILAFILLLSPTAFAQFTIQDSQTTADLRGIHSVDGSVAWASGTQGAVLRTVDGGAHWEKCAIPPDADKLDFRGIWAWDARTAEVMSAGPGELSRLFKTTDGCQHWTELFRNLDKDGFWDSLVYQRTESGQGSANAVLIGDPLNGRFFTMVNSIHGSLVRADASCAARPDEAAFAASNSSVFVFSLDKYIFVTGGKGGPRAIFSPRFSGKHSTTCAAVDLPLAKGEPSSGAFSVYFRDRKHGVVVGGDYKEPNESSGTATWTSDGGRHWSAASKLPHGYRSGVTWDPNAKAWIAVGTNGADISTDDGKTWRSLDNENWNTVSLPFAVGPKGRIGKVGATAPSK
jgi:photosystem II stability/assembly factor-like uncharacterized protein